MAGKNFDMPGSGPMFDETGAFTNPWAAWMSATNRTMQAIRMSGPTSDRPTSGWYIGQPFYDTTLNKPVWVSAITPMKTAVWRDAAGTVV